MRVTSQPTGHILTNIGVWSPDSRWIVYDTRSDAEGAVFDGQTIERVNVETGETQTLYRSQNGACCGVATCNPVTGEVVFILGPEHPTPDWRYGAYHRQGVIVDPDRPMISRNLDARDLVPPFTPGALRGGSHVHVFSPDGQWVSFTYEDHILAQNKEETADHEINLRNVGVSVPGIPVRVNKNHPRNHDGDFFTVLVTRTTSRPKPGSDDIRRAFEDAWVCTNGYVRADGMRQRRAIAFQGEVIAGNGEPISEVFISDLPEDLTRPGTAPLQGTESRRPAPPEGVNQRRLTFTAQRKYPGLQGPRHWLRSSPDGALIAFLARDDSGVVQLWTVSPNGGSPFQMTHNEFSIASAFSWSPDGKHIAHVMDNSVCITNAKTGETTRLTPRSSDCDAPRPEACVFSPDGSKIAFVQRVQSDEGVFNQIHVVTAR